MKTKELPIGRKASYFEADESENCKFGFSRYKFNNLKYHGNKRNHWFTNNQTQNMLVKENNSS